MVGYIHRAGCYCCLLLRLEMSSKAPCVSYSNRIIDLALSRVRFSYDGERQREE